ncbi:MAG TPA: DegT/DnrJ/EryC1/StrS family aminotransferase [Vicinamibacterales bacterium]|nr:DegT/DnrJ/EryC1/StrS family aminotransferase [Vicinamibacterales bacterium]
MDIRASVSAVTRRVPFMSLVPGPDADAVSEAMRRVVERGWFVLGPEVDAFEEEFAAASGAAHAVGVGNGTDALALALRAMGIGAGDEVITSPLSAAFSALAIMMAGATPVFADIDPDRLTIDPSAAAAAVTSRTAAIMPVHLYGQPADMSALSQLAHRRNLAILEDACQAHFATCAGRPVGAFGAAAAFSFYPTKNLGAFGDGGAIVTNDAAFADKVKRLRNGGQAGKYHHVEFGVNSRLDDLQAAILRARLPFMAGWTARRRALAGLYRTELSAARGVTVPPACDPGHVYHLFPVLSRSRESLQAHLAGAGIGTLVHYPTALHQQAAFAASAADCPVAARVAGQVLSLPLHPHLSDTDARLVAESVRAFVPND